MQPCSWWTARTHHCEETMCRNLFVWPESMYLFFLFFLTYTLITVTIQFTTYCIVQCGIYDVHLLNDVGLFTSYYLIYCSLKTHCRQKKRIWVEVAIMQSFVSTWTCPSIWASWERWQRSQNLTNVFLKQRDSSPDMYAWCVGNWIIKRKHIYKYHQWKIKKDCVTCCWLIMFKKWHFTQQKTV